LHGRVRSFWSNVYQTSITQAQVLCAHIQPRPRNDVFYYLPINKCLDNSEPSLWHGMASSVRPVPFSSRRIARTQGYGLRATGLLPNRKEYSAGTLMQSNAHAPPINQRKDIHSTAKQAPAGRHGSLCVSVCAVCARIIGAPAASKNKR
jgi:hypothetical protein